MRLELDQKLVNDFPHLYRNRYESVEKSLMAFGFECDDGWFNIIWELSEKLEAEILKIPEKDRNHYCALQIKEKLHRCNYLHRQKVFLNCIFYSLHQ
jgi:hypothetical protein